MARGLDRRSALGLGLAGLAAGLLPPRPARAAPAAPDPRERRFGGLRQLTFGGQNAEAYFDWTGGRLVFQSTRPPFLCDQIYTMRDDGSELRLVSSGKGRTTCGFFFPDGRRIIYASTHLGGPACPPAPDRSRGYVWPIYPSYEIFAADLESGALVRLRTTRDTTRKARCRPMASGSSSPRSATAISTSTSWTATAPMSGGSPPSPATMAVRSSHGMGASSCSARPGPRPGPSLRSTGRCSAGPWCAPVAWRFS